MQVLQDIALAKPKCLVDHISSFKLTAANFPKTTVSVIQLMSIIARTSADKSRAEGTLDYSLDVIGSVESEKHNLVLKEVITLTQKYPNLLNANFIHRVKHYFFLFDSFINIYNHTICNALLGRIIDKFRGIK